MILSEAEIVIVGGGVMGLGLAYNLAKRGQKNIVVLERSYLCAGASGRNGGGVRAQWSSPTNIDLMKESLAICAQFSVAMRFNIWFRKGGYLFVATDARQRASLEASAALQRQHGLRTAFISGAEVADLVPQLRTDDILGASYNPDDAVVFPWPFVWGYAEAARELGVEILTHTAVSGFEQTAGRLSAVHTQRGAIRTSRVLLCAGAESREMAAMAGVVLPSHPHRHEICSSEPLKAFMEPLVGDLGNGLYFSQSARGEIVGGLSTVVATGGPDLENVAVSTPEFMLRYAQALTHRMPILSEVKMLRQWAGAYDITPDGNPLVGWVDECPGLFLMSGFMGHGFMMAPVMTEKAAEHVLHGAHQELFALWNLRRYRQGRLLSESMILG